MNSSLVANATRKISSRRRGKYRMTMYKDLKTMYGAGVAKTLRDNKKDQEGSKAPGDSITYWCEHPDFKGMSGKEDWNLSNQCKYVFTRTTLLCFVVYFN